MKTLSELNSKWYWRLLKVIIIFVTIGISLFAIAGYFYFYQTYHPEDIQKVTDDIIRINHKINLTDEAIDKTKGRKINKEDLQKLNKAFIENHLLKTIQPTENSSLWLVPGSLFFRSKSIEIEGVRKCNWDRCDTGEDSNIIENYFQKDIPYYISEGLIEYGINKYNGYIAINKELYRYKDGKINFSSILYDWNELQSDKDKISGLENYLGFIGWIKVVASSVFTILGFLLFIYLVRGILFYIIFGKFRLEK